MKKYGLLPLNSFDPFSSNVIFLVKFADLDYCSLVMNFANSFWVQSSNFQEQILLSLGLTFPEISIFTGSSSCYGPVSFALPSLCLICNPRYVSFTLFSSILVSRFLCNVGMSVLLVHKSSCLMHCCLFLGRLHTSFGASYSTVRFNSSFSYKLDLQSLLEGVVLSFSIIAWIPCFCSFLASLVHTLISNFTSP